MGIPLHKAHLKRYRDLARLLVRYGRADLAERLGLGAALKTEEGHEGPPAAATELAGDLERMGPTFIKLGQLLSTRADLLPVPYVEALARLQDQVEPFAFAEVERIISEELGVRVSKAYQEIEETPLAAASLGQVHRAVLHDSRQVAVKVQRPEIRRVIADDLEVLGQMAEFLDRHTEFGHRHDFRGIFEEFRRSLLRELDYRQEAHNLATLRKNLRQFAAIAVPQAVEDLTTARVLTMELIHGRKVTSLTPLARTELDAAPLADELFRAYLYQILVDGFFHADPHPGNVFLTDEGQIALLDLGMVGRISPGMQLKLLKLLLAVSEGRSDEAAEVALEMGERRPDFDEPAFRRRMGELLARHQDLTVGQIEVGRFVLEISAAAADTGVRVPRELSLLGKTLLSLDQVGRSLDPEFDPNASIRAHAAELMRRRMIKSVSPGTVLSAVMEASEFVQYLPRRINRILDAVANNEIRIQAKALDEEILVEGAKKIANRITMGLVIASLIVASAMLMQVESPFQILGYPGLPILLFLAAVVSGVVLLVDIVLHDRQLRR